MTLNGFLRFKKYIYAVEFNRVLLLSIISFRRKLYQKHFLQLK